MTTPVLSVADLRVDFETPRGRLSAVDRVTLTVQPGQIMGLVGESGCGKSTLANAVMGLLDPRAEVSGSVRLAGEQLMGAGEARLQQLRGDRISMIFQDPSTSLDPTFAVGEQVAEAIRAHRKVGRSEARARAVALMSDTGIPDAAARYSDPPHRFSGGMRQRVVIAAALANQPAMLLADEPTTALDVTIQAQILRVIAASCRDRGTAVLLITHDLGVVAQVCDRVGVMYAGQLVEQAPVERLFAAPQHPYTRALLAALPSAEARPGRLTVIPGQVPDLIGPQPGCRFLHRCERSRAECPQRPESVAVGSTTVSCWDVSAALQASEGVR